MPAAKRKTKPVATPNNAQPVSFPEIQEKTELSCRILLQDQIILIENFLSAVECAAYVKFINALPLELTPHKKRGEAERNNYRLSLSSTDFASKLHSLLLPHIPSLPPGPTSRKTSDPNAPRLPHSLNSNIRLYKYTALQHFGPHYDDSVQDKTTGTKSEWTLLIYITGQEDGVEGGETVFYVEEKNKTRQAITVPLTRGTALLHRHGMDCLLHEGSIVRKGLKYVLRSDLMFLTNSHELMTSSPVLVTYSAPQAFLASGSWKQIQSSLLAQLPLRNIHWKSTGHATLRTIQELDFTLVQLEAIRDELTSQIPVTVLEKPLLNMYIVTCEDTDVEAYRLVHKKQVKDWLSIVTSRKNQDWLLLHLVKHDARAPGGKLFQLKGSVLERMRADFNTDKRDRCIQVIWTPGSEGSAAIWAEILNKIKDGLVYAFDSAISQREDEVKRSESQRQMPGWNFCTFFILKESLSNSFEGMNLFEEALLHYNELEEIFAHVLKEKNLSWFGSLIAPHQTDDSSPLLSPAKKPYRDLILANNISVFDLRIYLLARCCGLLAMLGKISEAARNAKTFLVAFSTQLRGIEATLPRFFIESWLYNSALSVVDQCDEWIFTSKTDESQLLGYYAVKGELLELAQIQLNLIGTKINHLPSRAPFLMAPQRDISADSTQSISNPDIRACIDDPEFFYDLYIRITNRAIEMYARSRRRKFALKLHETLAALDIHRGQLASALATYSSLPAHYAPHMWSSLESFALLRALDIHSELQQTKDTEWIHILLDFLKTVVECPEAESLINKSDRVEYISSLLQSLKTVSSTLETDLVHLDHPALTIKITDCVRLAGSEDGVLLDIVVQNHLPCSVPADEVIVSASGRDAENLLLSAKINELTTGKTALTLFCPVPCAGTYVLDLCQIRSGRLKLQWSYKRQSQRSPHPVPMPILIHVPPDPLALDIQVRQPSHIKLGLPPSILAIISTGRNHIQNLKLKLAATSVNFQFQNATDPEGQIIPTLSEDGVVYGDVAADTTLMLQVPYDGNSPSHILKISVDLCYTTTTEPNVSRTLRAMRILTTALPFSVNVEDFFRGKSLISKFTISTATHQHVRIASVKLEGPPELLNLRVNSCPTRQGVMTIRPGQPIHSLFRLDCDEGPVREPLTLIVQYRMLREEVEELVQTSVKDLFQAMSTTAYPDDHATMAKKLILALEGDASWVELYEMTGEVLVPGGHDEQGSTLLASVKNHLENHRHSALPDGTWRVMKIPVDVPQMHVIAAACIRINHDSEMGLIGQRTLYAGQPIHANLSIHTSFHWGSEKLPEYAMRFDIEEMVKDWLISGHKRGDFVAKDGETFNVPITMIALHHGELFLPKVTVTTLPSSSKTTMGSPHIPSIDTHQVHGAEKILVLPRGGRSTFVVGMGPS